MEVGKQHLHCLQITPQFEQKLDLNGAQWEVLYIGAGSCGEVNVVNFLCPL